MTKEQKQVMEFMKAAGQDCPCRAIMPGESIRILRAKLITEELRELAKAFGLEVNMSDDKAEVYTWGDKPDLIEAADAITDLLVVVIGCAVACGIDIQPCWDEVHRSNMSKFKDGHKREDGKWIKGPSYSPANLKPIIETQQLVGHKVKSSALTVNERSDIQMLIDNLTKDNSCRKETTNPFLYRTTVKDCQIETLRKVLSIL